MINAVVVLLLYFAVKYLFTLCPPMTLINIFVQLNILYFHFNDYYHEITVNSCKVIC